MLSHKALSVSNLKGDRERQNKMDNVIRREKSLDKYDEKPFIEQGFKLKNSFSMFPIWICVRSDIRGALGSEGQGADEPEKRQLRCYSKAT